MFCQHNAVTNQSLHNYDPYSDEPRQVHLFHGCRSVSWDSFRARGIKPPYSANEFSLDRTFYLTNSLRHAFEHPLHNHPSQNISPIYILVFKVRVDMLHALNAFSVYWFEQPDMTWAKFCEYNMGRPNEDNHGYDIVVGPTCIPAGGGSNSSSRQIEALRVDGELVTQLAFTSQKSQDWLNSYLAFVFREIRLVSD